MAYPSFRLDFFVVISIMALCLLVNIHIANSHSTSKKKYLNILTWGLEYEILSHKTLKSGEIYPYKLGNPIANIVNDRKCRHNIWK